jgi:phage terminase small subunit
MTKELTDKQKRFCDEYLIDLNATQAAMRAGYSEKTANEQGARLLANVSVQEYVQAKQKRLEKKTEISQEYVLVGFKKVFERCMQEEAVTDKDGNFEGVFKFEASGANKALEMLGKHLGMFKEKLEVGGKDGGAIEINQRINTTITTEAIQSRISQLLGKE